MRRRSWAARIASPAAMGLFCVASLAGCKLGLNYDDAFEDAGTDDHAAPDMADAASDGSAYAAAILADGPLLYLRFDEPEGAIATDASGNQRDGVLSGGTRREPTGAFTGSGGALWFDGVDDVVTIPDDEELRLNGDFSIEFWLRLDDTVVNDYPGVLTKGNATATGFIVFYAATNPIPTLKRANSSAAADFNGTPVTAASYSHMVVTYSIDLSRVTWYKDGVEVDFEDAVTYPANLDTTDLRLGRGDPTKFGRDFLDELAIYPTALSEEQVFAHYDVALGGNPAE